MAGKIKFGDLKKLSVVEKEPEDFFDLGKQKERAEPAPQATLGAKNETLAKSPSPKERVRIFVDVNLEDLRKIDELVAEKQKGSIKAVKRSAVIKELILKALSGR